MEAYSDFAKLYDEFMEDTPYDVWSDFLLKRLKSEGINDGLVLDLGCGTGEITRRLRDAGYDMIGVDSSVDMLDVAKEKEASDSDILYLCQDMREFELYGTVRAIVSICDCVNYILDPSELVTVFKLANNYLDPKGLFIFDFNTTYKYAEVIGDSTIAENRDDASFIWENFYDEESGVNEYDITFFKKEGELFRRFTETHLQKGYTVSEMTSLIEKSGLEFVEAIDADTHKKPTKTSERVYIIAREKGK